MKFEKVSLEQYLEDCMKDQYTFSSNECSLEDVLSKSLSVSGSFEALKTQSPEEIHSNIKIPRRATKKSAGYDIYAPYDFTLIPGDSIKISTGIRVLLDDDKFLMCAPRSGHGFKARIQLDNTVGIIDADYSDSSNEGHIILKLTNDSRTGKTIRVKQGEGMAQAIIMSYYVVDDDEAEGLRNGGFGSTNK